MQRIPTISMGIILMGILVICCFCGISVAEGKTHYMKYKDPKQPLNARIKDLLSRMSLEEKIGQMVQIERTVASAEVMKKYFIGKSFCTFRYYLYFQFRFCVFRKIKIKMNGMLNSYYSIFIYECGYCVECFYWGNRRAE